MRRSRRGVARGAGPSIAVPADLPLQLPEPGQEPTVEVAGRPDLAFTVLRPADLVALGVEGYHLALHATAAGPVLVPSTPPPGETARLVVHWPFQHVGERAFYEITNTASSTGQPPPPPPVPPVPGGAEPEAPPPVEARAAFHSRVVYAVPVGEAIVFSTEGVLAALERLPLMVAPTALPRPPSRLFVPLWPLGEGLVLGRGPYGLVVGGAAARARSRSRRRPAPDLDALLRTARDRRAARSLLALETATALVDRPDLPWLDDGLVLPRRPPIRRRPTPRRPSATETAIEAPYRLIISPSEAEGFTHATTPVPAGSDPGRVELWHSRIGVRAARPDGTPYVDERPDPQRIVRAIWNRDADDGPEPPAHSDADPFRTSLDPLDRFILVRQSADPTLATPQPVDARRLELSALGAWLDLHGTWDTPPYTSRGKQAIVAWDHVAPMGRDQYVRVLYPGYLFPLGHRCVLVKVTERKIKSATNPHAYLYQRKFLTVLEPVRAYDQRDFPFSEVRIEPLVTPDLIDPVVAGAPNAVSGADLFWPTVPDGGVHKFAFRLDCRDADGGFVRLFAPLLFVAESYADRAKVRSSWEADGAVPAHGQHLAYARSAKAGDTQLETSALYLTGDAVAATATTPATSVPHLDVADVVIPAMRHLAPDAPPATVAYAGVYLAGGFGGAANAGDVWAQLVDRATKKAQPAGRNTYTEDVRTVSFSKGTDKAGGFVQPDLPVRGLSRLQGAVGDIAGVAANQFKPADFLKGALPKLFGLFDLLDVLAAVGLDLSKAPAFVTESLDVVSALLSDLTELGAAAQAAVDRAADDMVNAPTAPLRDKAKQVRDAFVPLAGPITDTVANKLVPAVADLLKPGADTSPAAVAVKVQGLLDGLRTPVGQVAAASSALALAPPVKAQVDRLTGSLLPLLKDAATVAATVAKVVEFVNGFDPKGVTLRAHLLWQPVIHSWPDETNPVFSVGDRGRNGFTLAVNAQASGAGGMVVDVLAEIRDFKLHLLPGAELMIVSFDRIAFHATTSRKPEVDVVFGGLEFVGVLGFVETLRRLIPFDGFSDPPFVDVSPAGVDAGFTLALPGVGVGVFSLENISLGADCRIPFLGEALTVGFNFCTRDRPFQLTVMCIGGGGFVGVRLSPKGLVVLEMALEFGAALSIDLGVASGTVSVMGGVYLRLEAGKGQLTGYFRIRGEVDVLGLISASITLEMSLTYEFDTGKMVGRASVTVHIEILFLSMSVSVSCERRFAGSNGDPTFAEILAVGPGGSSPAWADYCSAFAPE